MFNIIKIYSFIFFLLISVLLFSCIKEEFDPDKISKDIIINPSVAAPVGYIHYELNEILKDSSKSWDMIMEPDGLISFFYETEIASPVASEIIQFPETNCEGSFSNNSGYPVDLSKIHYPYKQFQYDTVQFLLTGPDGPDYTDIDSIKVKSMTIIMYLSPRYELRGKMIISSPNTGPGIYKTNSQGNLYSWGAAFPIPMMDQSQTIIVENCIIIPFNDSTGTNLVPLIFEMRLDPSTGIVPENYNIINYIFTLQNLDYSAIYGYLGKFNFNIDPQAIPIDFYNSITGTFHFEQPRLNFYFENSFGLPVQILINDFYTTSANGDRTDITGDGLPSETNIQVIHYPTFQEFGMFAYDSLIIHHDDANLSDAMETSPSSMTFGLEARTNTVGNDTDNFIIDESRLNVHAKLILPLYGNSELVIVQDSLIFNFDDFFKNPPEEIKTLTVRLNFTNGFPVNISTQVYFADENYSIVDSIFDVRHLIHAGTDTDGDGIVEPLEDDPVEAELSRTKIDHLAISRYIILNGRLATASIEIPENFKFYSYYFLDAYIGVVGDLELNSSGY
jgi:hypothetical protein